MRRYQLHKTVLATMFLGSLLAAQSLTAPADDRIQTERYGAATGTTPNALRIHLERDRERSIRLSGGKPGGVAGLFIGDATLPTPHLHGAVVLVRGRTQRMGRFDADGIFRVPMSLAGLGEGDRLSFQGLHADGAVHQMTARLTVTIGDPPKDEFDLTTTHLPEIGIVKVAGRVCEGDLMGALQQMLNSKGDSVDVEIKGDLAVPVPVVGASLGAKFAVKVEIERTAVKQRDARGDDDTVPAYDVSVAVDTAATIGPMSNSDNLSATLAAGRGAKIVYRYATVAQAAQGLRYMALALALPGDGAAKVARTVVRLLEDFRRSYRKLDRALRETVLVPPFLRGWLWHEMRRLKLRVLDRVRGALQRAQDNAAQLIGLITALADAKRTINASRYAIEANSTVSLEAQVSGDAKFLEGSASAEIDCKGIMRFVFPTAELKLKRRLMSKAALSGGLNIADSSTLGSVTDKAGLCLSLGVQRVLVLELEDTFARRGDGSFGRTAAEAMFSVDTGLNTGAGGKGSSKNVLQEATETAAEVADSIGAKAGGKVVLARKIWVKVDRKALESLGRDAIVALLEGDDVGPALARLQSHRLSLSVQDRYEGGYVASLKFKKAGVGGSLQASTTWSDKGQAMTSELPAAECLQRILSERLPFNVFKAAFQGVLERFEQARDKIKAELRRALFGS